MPFDGHLRGALNTTHALLGSTGCNNYSNCMAQSPTLTRVGESLLYEINSICFNIIQLDYQMKCVTCPWVLWERANQKCLERGGN